ncbi:ribosome-associated ATPase/putative transporter RbbA [Bosea psychrotolerans]|uniref:Ribosome-dependent ATPase n=1 Tax=Bosea psychrotolerans TaxID=1871628 RepID=A0A2S4LXD8_9HYPH|nr:ribosome-associated ATPase/putative transporter RbbA [Bosea psychrotolerans]POR47120.1 ribosome-dependent ATPase [Bosea psychrotolerans]
MSGNTDIADDAIRVAGVRHHYGAVAALQDVSLSLPRGSDTAIIGPDGVGKSTLLGLIAGARIIQQGQVETLGGDMANAVHRTQVASRIAFMPQGLGKNLYPTLSVAENIDFFASLYATSAAERRERRDLLLKATGLDPFPDRPAGKLSGGMRQKLSLCCALVHDPELLILDEPTTGIDPLSRRQFWQLIDSIRAARPTMTLVVATAYMEEAERFSRLVAMDAGRILASGSRDKVVAGSGASGVEGAFIRLLHPGVATSSVFSSLPARTAFDGPPAIVAEGLTRRFGDFTAVDNVSFRIERGEIFGFLGSNGCGKTTTMKMLTGLLPASLGRAELLGRPVDATDIETRRRVGYMSQSFSLYSELTVRGNLELHAKLYHLASDARDSRITETLKRFDLDTIKDAYPAGLPLGVRQRLQLAAACLHRPEVLILDEPTSGVDPEARDRFWSHLGELSRRDGVTIFISTHFMNEAERCDRVSFMHAGKVLAVGTPDELRKANGTKTLEGAFIACLEQGGGAPTAKDALDGTPAGLPTPPAHPGARSTGTWLSWVGAFAGREAREVLRDPIRLSFALLAPLLLMMTFARGISFDIESLPFSIYDRDRSAESQSLTVDLAGSRYFSERAQVLADVDVDRRLQSGDAALVIEIPPGFGRDLLRGHQPTISLWLDGANPSRANTARGYAEGVVQSFIDSLGRRETAPLAQARFNLEPRFFYNQDFRSVYAMTPGVIMFLLMMILAMMTALGVVREREMGSIINLAVSPASTGAFLVGKFLPYVAIGTVTLMLMIALAVFGLDLSIKGSFAALLFGGVLYVVTAATFGILVSSFVRSQVAAIFACALLTLMPALNFSGFLQPISNLSPAAQLIGLGFPSSWFQQISMGVFAKGLPFESFLDAFWALAIFPVIYLVVARLLLNKQEP